ncbi:MAG TPA: LuxR C-terminal-related transcriptional regulator [Polyangiales bacterium]
MATKRPIPALQPLGRRDQRQLEQLEARLTTVDAAALTPEPAPAWLAPALQQLLECTHLTICRPLRVGHDSWSVGEASSTDADFVRAYDAALRQGHYPFHYNLLQPEPAQRNQVYRLAELHSHAAGTRCSVEETLAQCGVPDHDQLRVLICDGPILLAWVGGFRQTPFEEREKALLAALVPALQRRLSVQRMLLDTNAARLGLPAALDLLGAPAFVARPTGRIAHANVAGRTLFDQDPHGLTARLLSAIDGTHGPSISTPVAAPGLPELFVIVLRDQADGLELRLQRAAAHWKPTRRERDVLRHLAAGDANKEIAVKLACSEANIEHHVTSLLRKARCDGRCRLIARFWALD